MKSRVKDPRQTGSLEAATASKETNGNISQIYMGLISSQKQMNF